MCDFLFTAGRTTAGLTTAVHIPTRLITTGPNNGGPISIGLTPAGPKHTGTEAGSDGEEEEGEVLVMCCCELVRTWPVGDELGVGPHTGWRVRPLRQSTLPTLGPAITLNSYWMDYPCPRVSSFTGVAVSLALQEAGSPRDGFLAVSRPCACEARGCVGI